MTEYFNKLKLQNLLQNLYLKYISFLVLKYFRQKTIKSKKWKCFVFLR